MKFYSVGVVFLLKGILFPIRRVLEQFPTVNLLIFPLKACDRGPLPDINGVIYNPYKWRYKWVSGIIIILIGAIVPCITIWGPPCVGCGNLGETCRVNTGHWRLAISRPHRAAGCPAHHVSFYLAESLWRNGGCLKHKVAWVPKGLYLVYAIY